MNQDLISRLSVILMIIVLVGCRHRRDFDCSRIDTCRAVDAAAILESSSNEAGISRNFDKLEKFQSPGNPSLSSILSGGELSISLHDACCLAALNSPTANLIDKERKAVCCESGCVKCIDQFLAGQALEQRNKSSANSGELFLRLVETHLQGQLIDQSVEKIAELENTIRVADENGQATAKAEAALAEQVIGVQQKQVELYHAALELSVKLNLILGIDSCFPRNFQPAFDLEPQLEEFDVEQLVIEALSNRAELKSMNGFGGCSPNNDCLSILSQIDPRLGIKLASKARKCFLVPQAGNHQESSCCSRRSQINDLKNAREELVRQQVIDAVIDVQRNYDQLLLQNANLARLEQRLTVIESSAVLDAQSAFVDSIMNWAEQQQAKSKRISSAIKFEIAKVRLKEATGRWITECGLCIAKTGCSCCRE